MATINQLSAADQLSGSDLLPLYSQANGDARKISLTNFLSWLDSQQIATQDNKITQYASPSATGFSVQVNGTGSSVWLVLTPLAAYAAGTIVLPPVAGVSDKQELLVNTTQAITTLTISANGASTLGAPTSFAQYAYFRLRFDAVMKTWYRVG